MDDPEFPPRRLTRAEAKAETRQRLLNSAAHVFARKGYTAASVEEIATAAGYTVGAVYSNFGNKEQLFTELLSERAAERVGEATGIVADPAATPHERINALSRLLVDVADKDIDFAPLQAEFWLYAIRNPTAMETLAQRTAASRQGVRRLVDEALRRRDITDEATSEALATIALALFQGLVRLRRIDTGHVPEALFGQALTWLLDGIQASASTDPATRHMSEESPS